jgi:hypothetical protein
VVVARLPSTRPGAATALLVQELLGGEPLPADVMHATKLQPFVLDGELHLHPRAYDADGSQRLTPDCSAGGHIVAAKPLGGSVIPARRSRSIVYLGGHATTGALLGQMRMRPSAR